MTRSRRTRVSQGVMAVVLGAVSAACGVFNGGTSRQMVPASREPQTEAMVRIRRSENGANIVTVTARDVAPPGNVAPGATTYLVWIRATGKPAVNAGPLQIRANRTAFLETTTSYDRFTVLITAERTVDPIAPLGRAAFTIAANTE